MKSISEPLNGERVDAPDDVQALFARHIVLPAHDVARGRIYRHETIADFLARTEWRFRLPTICVVNGAPVLREEWPTRKLKGTDNVVFLSKPWGGGSTKQVLGLVALVALSAIAPVIGAGIVTGLGLPATILGGAVSTGALIGAGITLGGALLINTLIAPKPGGQNDNFGTPSQIYSVSAAGNTGRPLQPIPVAYGKTKEFADFAATPWSEFIGNDQYLNVLLVNGCGKYLNHQLFIDDTVLWDRDAGVNPDFDGVTVAEYGPGEPVTLFPLNITQAVEVSGQELPDPNQAPTPGWVGGFIANAAGTLANEIAIDLVFPTGCFSINDNNIGGASVRVLAEARLVDDAGAPLGPFVQTLDETMSFWTQNPQRVTFKFTLGAGRYEVRLRRTTTPRNGANGADSVLWAGLRAFLQGPSSFPGVSTVAIRIKASAQLTANSAKRFAILRTRILSVWNSDAAEFQEEPTQNAYWAAYDAATNPDYGVNRPPSKIDFQNFVDGAAAAAARGDTFNYVFRSVMTCPQALDTILKTTRARHRWSGDVLTTFRDEWREVPDMLLTDREIIRGTLSVNWSMNNGDSADSVIVEYLDERTWGPAEVQYPANSETFQAVAPARVQIPGITNREHAFREAAFLYLQAQVRRTNLTLDTEHDGRRLNFGSMIRVQTELPQTMGQAGVVVSRAGTTLTLKPAPDWSESGQHFIAVRDRRGRLFGPVKCARGASDALAALDAADLATVEGAGQTLDQALARADGADDPSFAFGIGTTWSKPCQVISGKPNKDRVTLKLFVDDASVHTTDLGAVPAPPSRPPLADQKAPQIQLLNAHFRQGVAEPRLDASWLADPGAIYYIADVSYDNGQAWLRVYEGQANALSAVVDRAALLLRVAAVGVRRGGWKQVAVDAPTIVIAPGTVAVSSLQDALKAHVIDATERFKANVAETLDRIASLQAELAANQSLDKAELKTSLVRQLGQITASYKQEIQVAVGPGSAIAQALTELQAAVNDVSASLNVRFIVGVTPEGAIAAYELETVAESAKGALSIVAFSDLEGNKFSEIRLASDRFFLGASDSDVSGAFPFIVDTTVTPPRVILNGDIIAPGTVTVEMLTADFFEAVNAHITNLDATNIKSNYALYNKYKRTESSVNSSVVNLPSVSGGPHWTSTGTTDIFSFDYKTVNGGIVLFVSYALGTGSDGFPSGLDAASETTTVDIFEKATGNLLSSFTVGSSSGAPSGRGGTNHSNIGLLNIAARTTVTVKLRSTVSVTTFIGGSYTWTWTYLNASLLFFEPNGT